MDLKAIGKYLLEMRTKQGYSQGELASFFNVTPQAISKWERGVGLPDVSLLLAIANFYHVTLDNLLLLDDNNNFVGEYHLEPSLNGKCIRILRKSKHLSQKDLASILHITFQSVSKWERGETIPEMDTLIQICHYFEISLDDFFHNTPLQEYQSKRKKNLLRTIGGSFIILCLITLPLFLNHHNNSAASSSVYDHEGSATGNPNPPSLDISSDSTSSATEEIEEYN